MPATVTKTYGKKAPVKRKTSPPNDDAAPAAVVKKRPRLTPPHAGQQESSTDDEDALPAQRPDTKPPPPSPPAGLAMSSHSNLTRMPSGTPTKLAKRMLGRSRTESSIENQPSTSGVGAIRTPSLPILPPSPQKALPTLDQERKESKPLFPTSASTPRVKRTYAGQSRSFLISLPVSDLNPDALRDIEREEDGLHEPESYSSLRARWGVDNSEDDPVVPPRSPPNPKSKSNPNTASPSRKGKGKSKAPVVYLPPGMMNPLKSITELRSKGESRRFLDEIGFLFEGMAPSSSMGLRRSSASEITTKLCDEDFAQKAKAADFYHKTWDVFIQAGAGSDEDKVLDTLLAFLASLIARDPETLADLARQESRVDSGSSAPSVSRKGKERARDPDSENLVDILFLILKRLTDVDPLAMVLPSHSSTSFEFKQVNLGKKDKIMLSNIRSTVSNKSGLFPEDTPITSALLVTHSLRSLPPSLISSRHLPGLLSSLRQALNTSFSSNCPFDGSYPSEEDRAPQYECIRNHLRLLDTYLLHQWASSSSEETIERQNLEAVKSARDSWLVDGLIAIAACAQIKGGDAPAVRECLDIPLRVLVNLTNGDVDWAKKALHNDYIVNFLARLLVTSDCLPQGHESDLREGVKVKVEVDEEHSSDEDAVSLPTLSHTLDRLCLALALLINLVQMVPSFKNILRQKKFSPTCSPENKACAQTCHCSDAMSILQILVKIYQRQSNPNPTTGVVSGRGKNINLKLEPSPSPPPGFHSPEVDASLIQGTLAILFGLIMRDSIPNRVEILAAISPPVTVSSSRSSDKAKVGRLLEQAREFMTFYNILNSTSAEGKKDERVANEVVAFLERLKDEC